MRNKIKQKQKPHSLMVFSSSPNYRNGSLLSFTTKILLGKLHRAGLSC